MRKLPQISEAEFEVMKVVWKYAPINCELPVKLTLDDTNDVFSRFSAYFEQ